MQSSFFKRLGHQFVDGILKANYREIQLDEIFGIYRITLPKPVLSHAVEHPSLLFNSLNISSVRMRQMQSPYAEWAEQIVNAALDIQRDPTSPLLTELERSRIAKLNSFAYLLTLNPAFREDAKNALLSIRNPDPIHSIEGGRKDHGWGDWMQTSQALRQYGIAYDLLYHELNLEELHIIEQKLISQTEQIIRHLILIPKNNHTTAIASGIGTMALVLDHPMRQYWLDMALSQLQTSLHMIEPDGSYREGAYYARFIASCLYPFAFYLYNVTKTNLLQLVPIRRLNRWLIDMEKPDGSIPDFDDAFPEYLLYQPIIIGLAPESEEIQYFFNKNQSRLYRHDAGWIEAYCAFQNQYPFKEPVLRSAAFYPTGGMAVFQNHENIFGLLLGEPGRPHLSGHDHIEPTSFTLSGFGQDLLIDGGYGPGGVDDPNRAWYVSAEAHNIPLVNGRGPNQNPIWGDSLGGKLKHCYETPSFSSATVETKYQNTQINRTVCFIGQRYFAVIDRLHGHEKKEFSIPWHGLGNLRFIDHHHVQWQDSEVMLDGLFLQPEHHSLAILPRVGLHTLDTEDRSHNYILIRFPLSSEQQLLSLFLPQNLNQDVLMCHPIAINSEGRGIGYEIKSNLEEWKDMIVFADHSWKCQGIESDAKIVISRKSKLISDTWISVISGSYLQIGGEMIFQSTNPVNLTLILDQQGWYGYIDASCDSTEINFYPSIDPGIVLLNHFPKHYTWANHTLTFKIQENGILQMSRVTDQIRMTKPIHNNLTMMERLSISDDVQRSLNVLAPAERIKLQNEITRIMGEAGIQSIDHLTNCDSGIAALYHVISGILNSSYNQSGNKIFTCPQIFEWQDKLFGHQVQFYEEGTINKNSFQIRKFQLMVDERFRFSQNQFFKGYQENTCEVRGEKSSLYAHTHRFQDQDAYQIGLRHQDQDQWVSMLFNHDQREQGREAIFSFGKNHWNSCITWIQQRTDLPDYIRIHGHGAMRQWSSTLDCEIEEQTGLQCLQFNNWVHLSRTVAMQTSIIKTHNTEQQCWKSDFSSQLWFATGSFMGALSLQQRTNQKTSREYQCVYFHKNWRFDSQGEYQNRFEGDFGIGFRSRMGSLLTRFHRDRTALFQGTYRPCLNMTSILRISGMVDPLRCQKKGFGLFYHNRSIIGCEVELNSIQSESLWGITTTIGIPIGKHEYLQFDATSFYRDNGHLKYYEIRMNQKSQKTTPGILLIGDERNLVRFEGYIQWVL